MKQTESRPSRAPIHHSPLELALAPIAALLALGLSGSAAAMPVYLNDQNITVTLVSSAFLTGGVIGNVIDAASPADSEQHSQSSSNASGAGGRQLRPGGSVPRNE